MLHYLCEDQLYGCKLNCQTFQILRSQFFYLNVNFHFQNKLIIINKFPLYLPNYLLLIIHFF